MSDTDYNGILAQVPGEYIGAATQRLPDPVTATADTVSTEVDAGWVGRVRITFERQVYRRRKFSRIYWIAKRADRVSAEEPPTPS